MILGLGILLSLIVIGLVVVGAFGFLYAMWRLFRWLRDGSDI